MLSTFTVLAILYLEDVLEKNLQSNQIVNFYALDYFQKYAQTHNIYLLKEGGDLCLLKSSIFPGRQKFIRKKDYMFFGKQFYYHYFKNTDNGVFASLSDYFDFYASNLEKFFNLFKTKS